MKKLRLPSKHLEVLRKLFLVFDYYLADSMIKICDAVFYGMLDTIYAARE